MFKIGEINQFVVIRKTDLGYMLKNKNVEEEILLHFNQTMGRELSDGSIIECFVQYDSRGRISATLEEPTVTISKPGFAKVVEVNPRLGVFASINTFKDVLISKDDLPTDFSKWPLVGERLFIKLEDKKGRLNGHLFTKKDFLDLKLNIPKMPLGSKVKVTIVRVGINAINAITDELYYVYVSNKQFRGSYHLGEETIAMIIGYHEDEIVASLNKEKEEMVPLDEEAILDYLKKHKEMPYTSKTDAGVIEEVFHMSRKAFKRALGALYKSHKVLCEEDKTTLIE